MFIKRKTIKMHRITRKTRRKRYTTKYVTTTE